jgi:hypothetical protein
MGRPKGSTTVKNNVNDEFINLLKQMKDELDILKAENNQLKMAGTNSMMRKDDPGRLVTVIHMDDLVPGLYTVIKGDTQYTFTFIGDKHRIRLSELEKIMSTQKKHFARGILAFGAEDQDMYDYFSIENDPTMTVNQFKAISKLSSDKLSELYKSVNDLHKELILRHWTLQCRDNPTVEYVDLSKLNTLNTISGGKLQHIISDIGNIKIKG